MKYLITLLILLSSLYADNVYFNNGSILINVKVIEKGDKLTKIQSTSGKVKSYPNTIIKHIEYKPIQTGEHTQYVEDLSNLEQKLASNDLSQYKYPSIKLLPVSVISFTLAWSYLDGVGNLPKNTKTKRIIQGSLFMAAGLVNLFISFKQVEVKSKNNMISLNYHF